MEKTIGNEIGRILADAGYRGHNAPQSHKFRIFTAGQKRRVTPAIKRQMRRRSSPSSATSRANTEWAATTSPASRATPSTPSWPPPAPTSPSCSGG
ncbi:hypothetical protein BQ8794_130056 [Mesorhizobium prunaredense]|uniref:Uncharacterized protein n=1 Tax=Mesorhizobium prunaredense TaxID=1631249 RepID=A0A1R3V0Z5_9HYPH|nr:hypothetical protein BQ8794_130056 [Mesorhizobium prunaredense]